MPEGAQRVKGGMSEQKVGSAKLNRSGATTRARIVEAAIVVMAERGFAGITLQAVAAEAGVLYGNLTHHYPSRDKLIEALLGALLERYRTRFTELAEVIASKPDDSLEEIVRWLLDDAVQQQTGPVFLELWAMASHSPDMATAMETLYDEAVIACIDALGVSQKTAKACGLRDALYMLGAVLEGSSAIFSARPRDTDIYGGFRATALDTLVQLLTQKLAEARTLDASSAP